MLLSAVQEMVSKSRWGVGLRVAIYCVQQTTQSQLETISFTEKMRFSEILKAVLSMVRVINTNTFISRVSLFVGDMHFPSENMMSKSGVCERSNVDEDHRIISGCHWATAMAVLESS